ncbi:uncharacterized protein DFL_006472 [Arthrobotrys flagrans]|uniref:Uncharacterized protein n=1 Tax=Arthrobotrys flagrans TaxID=97331 RepID=A0A437A157_ARTFL|nr:hypothetical protein DFL_006472 [Arthrobotrys flagrans]
MFAGTKEPSFNLRTWNTTLGLIPHVVRQRMIIFLFPDDVVYDILWAGLVDLIVKIEKKGLQPRYEKLDLNTVGGVLVYETENPYNLKLKDQPPSTYKFLDELAKARDGLWREVRESAGGTPLPPIFPTGLPIQALIWPYTIASSEIELVAPYTYIRASDAVYLRQTAEDPIPTGEETRTSIGLFVDDFGAALRLLVPQHLDFMEKKARLKQVLHYAIHHLSGRLERVEAVIFWKQYLSTKS